MALPGSLQLSHDFGHCKNLGCYNQHTVPRIMYRTKLHLSSAAPLYHVSFLKQDCWRTQLFCNINSPVHSLFSKSHAFKCHSFLGQGPRSELPIFKGAATALARSYNLLQCSPVTVKLIPAIGTIIFALWGVAPLIYHTRKRLLQRSDSSWKKSSTHYVVTSYIQPLLLWTGAILICRALDPLNLPSEAAQVVKERLLSFVRSLSTVLAFAYCLSCVIQQAQKFFMESAANACETRNMGFQFAGKAVYSAVWIAAFSLFMELLGFSTQRWVTAGGLGTVLLTLAGREIFTNFLSSAIIHATRPFVVNEWIQTKVEGYEVSGTVEHVGWWSPTIVRGENREAVYIPNHKFTMNVVRNLSQKTHWRFKTHLAISHMDVNKINNIVADMRKVLAKSPQVEQQKLHRRVFLDNIDPENQALLILVSCFVKTSHHEEFLCVKEALLLDLLRVIGHHRARLATPVRTLQKIYSDADLENIPYVGSVFGGTGTVSNRPIIIEPPYKIKADDTAKGRSARPSNEGDNKTAAQTKVGPTAPDSKVREAHSDSKVDVEAVISNSDATGNSKVAFTSKPDPQVGENEPIKMEPDSFLKENLEAPHMSASNSKATGAAVNNMTERNPDVIPSKNSVKGGGRPKSMPTKQQDEMKSTGQSHTSRPALEENIVLGVALEGSKRTLPIEEGMNSSTAREVKEMAAQGGNRSLAAENGKDK
ncbi:mechanosensitive ion channel protein 2, chloroplastic-like [Prosopis cineraria]|uniref:mechanosensitive ion channel protein 2, chloroplastic-like n=1 Tax=Prosopis cineraria TaxID=364024 RepID=UPI00240F9334|nr:mechanosensitive ion channel protein 2, chloroplastic-like [Prosopis cineraria]XP_054809627.1 mechanosensitive ion channel protein 2, chloroplastic-like [Prosopis cineraria]XP_054809629.1 mechanosensitive ion channel protein 2, chloroplastic-like [Prosopis cineraria]XP_054809630.1 mechanosensitive ion channel protein 2, chloroplastic-like [Prosopis cineraria]XP_054809631.1 mechanosensitive ion channel protein 2, chloroplastic-like [Prosopis cineraria]XP_054809632.1 mechanosensitive ion chan